MESRPVAGAALKGWRNPGTAEDSQVLVRSSAYGLVTFTYSHPWKARCERLDSLEIQKHRTKGLCTSLNP